MVRLQHLLDAGVDAFDHAIGLRVHRWRQALFDTQIGAQLIKLVPAGGGALAQAEQAAVNSLPLSVSIVRIRIGQARSRSREATVARWQRSWICRRG